MEPTKISAKSLRYMLSLIAKDLGIEDNEKIPVTLTREIRWAILNRNLAAPASLRGERLVCITGGGDWYDASVDLLSVPASMDMEAESKAHSNWFRNRGDAPYLSFSEWLKLQRGARDATAGEIEVFQED